MSYTDAVAHPPPNTGEIIMRTLSISVAAAAILALSSGLAVTEAGPNKNARVSGTPPHASTTGTSHRSKTANTRGANRKGFCPPGQAKKPGKGRAFNC
jgi:hypothetical protein